MNNSQAQKNALQRIDIPSPCTASWEKMTGNDRVRHCGDCDKNVFNLSAMPEAAAAALVAENADGELCVRFYRRQDGTVLTSDCGASMPAAYVAAAWSRMPGVAGIAFAALSAAGCAPLAAPTAAEIPASPYATITMGAPEAPREAIKAAPVEQVSIMGGRVRMGRPDMSQPIPVPVPDSGR